MKNREPWSFCETPKEKCTMNYCDENGCQNRKRNYVKDDVVYQVKQLDYHLCKPIVNVDWTYLRCECGKRFNPKG